MQNVQCVIVSKKDIIFNPCSHYSLKGNLNVIKISKCKVVDTQYTVD